MPRRLALPLAALALLLAAPYLSAAPAAKPAEEKTIACEPASPELVQVADDVAKEVEAIRGWKYKQPVKKAVCTPEQIRAYMTKEIDKHYPDAKVAQVQAGLRLVGLIPEGCDLRKNILDLLQSQVEGFYDTDTKTFYMVKRSAATYKSLLQRTLIAHELTHALDDQYLDLSKLIEEGERLEDRDMARSAVAEGSATSTMTHYLLRAQGTGQEAMTELQQYMQEESARNKVFTDMPPYFQTMMASYVCGLGFLTKGNVLAMALPGGKDVGEEMIAAAKDPPNSTHEILHPEVYWDPAKREKPVLVADKEVEAAVALPGFQVIGHDVFGELNAAVLTTPRDRKPDLMKMGLAAYWTNPVASAWAGDRFFLLAPGKDIKNAKAVWVTVWNSPDARDSFVKTYDACVPPAGRAAWKFGNMGAVFFYHFTQAELAAAEKKLETTPPTCTRDGKPWAPWAL